MSLELPPLTAFPGDAVDLVAQVAHGAPEDVVRFTISGPQGVLDVLEAGVQPDGVARAPWVVQTGQLALPAELTFRAECLGDALASGVLRVEPPELRAAQAWHLDPAPSAAATEVRFEEAGAAPPEPGELVGDAVPAGVPLVLRGEVGAGGRPVQGGVSASITLERAPLDGGAFAPWKQFTAAATSARGVRAIALAWRSETEGEAPHRVRATIAWRAGERDAGATTSRVLRVAPEPDPAPNPEELFVPGPWDVVVALPRDGERRVEAVRLSALDAAYDVVLPRIAATGIPGALVFHFPEGPAGAYRVQLRLAGRLVTMVSGLTLPDTPPPPGAAPAPGAQRVTVPDGCGG